MKVAFVSCRTCIRVKKQIYALVHRGIKVQLMTAYDMPPFWAMNEICDLFIPLRSQKSVRTAVKESSADIFHVDGDPDWLVREVKEAAGDRPVIYDMHDLWSGIHGRITFDEIDTLHMTDGLIFVSEAQRQDALRRFKPKVPSTVIHCCCNYWQFIPPDDRFPSMGDLVYVGGLGSPTNPHVSFAKFRDYLDIFRRFRDNTKTLVHIYGVGGPANEVYHQVAVLHPTLGRYTDLVDRLSGYKWGFVGFQDDAPPMVQQAMPNKMFEYLAAGVVPIVYNCNEAANFVEEHGFGARLEKIEQFNEIKKDHAKYLKNIIEKRDKWTMENEVEKSLQLYDIVLNKRSSDYAITYDAVPKRGQS